jgi:voltage-gated potassium channel
MGIMMDQKQGNALISAGDEGELGNRDKEELIRMIQHLSRENERQKTIIQYQREEIRHFAGRSSGPEGRETNHGADDEEEGTLLPLLEALEKVPIYQGKSRLRSILTDAFLNKNSRSYPAVNTFLVGLIFFSVICVILESVPEIMERWRVFFYWSEMVVVGLFTIEYIINIYIAEDKLQYIFSLWGIIDLIAILPSYFYMADLRDIKLARTLRVIRCLRTLRSMRVLKLAKGMRHLPHQKTGTRINTLKIDLEIYATALFSVIVIFSTLVYYAEHHIPGTPFTHIPAAMWWCLVTITTVGYGDMHPATIIGKLIAAVAMIIGLALFGILMNVIAKAMIASLAGPPKHH